MAYPIIFFFMSRLWSVSHRRGYVTSADFVRGRYGSRGLSLAIAVTGFVATMPYIALQLIGIQAVLEVAGIGGSGNWLAKDLPLLIAFAVLAAYTYTSGLRAPAIIAFVKDALIYLVIVVAVIYLPTKVGGWGHIFDAADTKMQTANKVTGKTQRFDPGPAPNSSGPTSPWPSDRRWRCSCTRTRSPPASRPRTGTPSGATPRSCRRTPSCWRSWHCWDGSRSPPRPPPSAPTAKPNAQLVIPQLFEDQFPSWFAGIAFAAIAVGALVPAAIMSIAAANTFTRNIYKEWLRPDASPKHEAQVSKIASLVVKVFAVGFVLTMDKQNAINLQLLGGIWILQTFPAIVFGLYTRWFHRWALLTGWAVAMAYGTWSAYGVANPATKVAHFGGSTADIPIIGKLGYIAFTALIINIVVSAVLTVVLERFVPRGQDETIVADYFADADDPRVAAYDPEPRPLA